MRRTRRIGTRRLLITLVVASAATLLGSSVASAAVSETTSRHTLQVKAGQTSEIPYLSHGVGVTTPSFEPITSPAQQFGGTDELPAGVSEGAGAVTPTDLARAVTPQTPSIAYLSWGATAETAHEFTISGVEATDTPLIRNDRRMERELRGHDTVAAAGSVATSSGFDRSDVAIGFGLGLALAAACALALALTRNRVRVAHS